MTRLVCEILMLLALPDLRGPRSKNAALEAEIDAGATGNRCQKRPSHPLRAAAGGLGRGARNRSSNTTEEIAFCSVLEFEMRGQSDWRMLWRSIPSCWHFLYRWLRSSPSDFAVLVM
jgi:hypothetical protein